MKRWIAGIFTFLCAISLMGCDGTNRADTINVTVDSPVAGKKVAYIMQMAPSDIFQMWSESAQETAEALGMEYDAFFCCWNMCAKSCIRTRSRQGSRSTF